MKVHHGLCSRLPVTAFCSGMMLAPITAMQQQSMTLTTLRASLCTACEHVWLDAKAEDWPAVRPDGLDSCFELVNLTCSDCRRDIETSVCSSALFFIYPQPISGAFGFCEGHVGTSAESMSVRAWVRLM